MTNRSASAQALVDTLVRLFAALPQVEAVALGGSRSSGMADEISDIDLYVYTHADIAITDRQALVEQAGGASRADLGLTFWGPGDEWFDAATGLEVDIVYFDARWLEDQMQRVMGEHQASLGYTTCFWRTIRQSQIYHDPRGWLHNLQDQSRQPYPDALRRAIVTLNHPVLRTVIPSYVVQLEKAVQRTDYVSINHRVAALLASYFDILFAVNRVLHPGEKRLIAFALNECSRLPPEMPQDVHAVLSAAGAEISHLLPRVHTLLDRLDDLLEREGFEIRDGKLQPPAQP